MKSCEEKGWQKMQESGRHSHGWEMIPVGQFDPDISAVYRDVKKLMVLRNGNGNLPMAGVREGKEYIVLYIATSYNELYKH